MKTPIGNRLEINIYKHGIQIINIFRKKIIESKADGGIPRPASCLRSPVRGISVKWFYTWIATTLMRLWKMLTWLHCPDVQGDPFPQRGSVTTIYNWAISKINVPSDICVQGIVKIRAVWSESLLSAWRNLASLAIQNVPRKDFDMTANEQADLNLRLAHLSKGAFFLTFRPNYMCYIMWNRTFIYKSD